MRQAQPHLTEESWELRRPFRDLRPAGRVSQNGSYAEPYGVRMHRELQKENTPA